MAPAVDGRQALEMAVGKPSDRLPIECGKAVACRLGAAQPQQRSSSVVPPNSAKVAQAGEGERCFDYG